MNEQLHISDVILDYISGDWGDDKPTEENTVKVACVRGADINDVNASKFDTIPTRYISAGALQRKCLPVGSIIIEKSGGTNTQSTGRVAYISKECKEANENIICSNFCVAFTVKPEWEAQYIYNYLQYIYTTGAFFNFEGKTSGIHNLQVEQAFAAIPIRRISKKAQKKAATIIATLDRKIALNRQINQNLPDHSLAMAAVRCAA